MNLDIDGVLPNKILLSNGDEIEIDGYHFDVARAAQQIIDGAEYGIIKVRKEEE